MDGKKDGAVENIKRKNAILYTIFTLVVFAPTVLIVIILLAQNANGASPDVKNTADGSDTVITLPSGDRLPVSEDYLALEENALSIEKLPEKFRDKAFVELEKSGVTYRFYFSDDMTEAYYTVSGEKVFKVNEIELAKFLEKGQAVPANAAVPGMFVNGAPIYPTKDNFYYSTAGGARIDLSKQGSDADKHISNTQIKTGNILISFDVAPTECMVTLYNGDRVIFSGTPAILAQRKFENYKSVFCKVNAKWSGGKNSVGGSAAYEFRILFGDETDTADPSDNNTSVEAEKPLPEFKCNLDSDSIAVGEYTVLYLENVMDISSVNISFTPPMKYTPELYLLNDGEISDRYYALLAIPADSDADIYFINVSYGGGDPITLKLSVADRLYKVRDYAASEALVRISRSREALEEYDTILKAINSIPSSGEYRGGRLDDYDQTVYKDSNIFLGYGYYRSLYDGTKYRLDGVDYRIAEGTEITAIAPGKVIYTGYCRYLGNYTVIDHGSGVRSWYAHLGTVTVENGSNIEVGGKIGTAGRSGFTISSGVYLMCTVNGINVSPYRIIEEGLLGSPENIRYEDIILG